METTETFGKGCGRNYVDSQLTKIGNIESVGCQLCSRAWEARDQPAVQAAKGSQQHSRLPTTQSRGTCITVCMLHWSQKASSNLSRLTKKVTWALGTLWRREEILRICSEEDLAKLAQGIEVTVQFKKSQEKRYNLNPVSFCVNSECFWYRQLDGVAINKVVEIEFIVEFKWSTDRDEGFLEVKEAKANEQHKSIIGASRVLSRHDIWVDQTCNRRQVQGRGGSGPLRTGVQRAPGRGKAPFTRRGCGAQPCETKLLRFCQFLKQNLDLQGQKCVIQKNQNRTPYSVLFSLRDTDWCVEAHSEYEHGSGRSFWTKAGQHMLGGVMKSGLTVFFHRC